MNTIIKISTLIIISLIIFNEASAQIYTPSGEIQGSSGNNFVGIQQQNPNWPLHIYEQYGQGTSLMIDAATNANANILFSANGFYKANLRYDESGTGHFQIQTGYPFTAVMDFSLDGKVGIGTSNLTTNDRLFVNGSIKATEIRVETGWADFVFEKDYNLPSLKELEQFINKNKHLPDIPTEEQVIKEGICLGEMNSKLLQKVEELTLYVIDLQKQIDRQNSTISKLTTQND